MDVDSYHQFSIHHPLLKLSGVYQQVVTVSHMVRGESYEEKKGKGRRRRKTKEEVEEERRREVRRR